MKDSTIELNNLEFCVFDLETTGGNHQKDGIIEIGLVIIKNRKIENKEKLPHKSRAKNTRLYSKTYLHF